LTFSLLVAVVAVAHAQPVAVAVAALQQPMVIRSPQVTFLQLP
jgi:hypothetical protein